MKRKILIYFFIILYPCGLLYSQQDFLVGNIDLIENDRLHLFITPMMRIGSNINELGLSTDFKYAIVQGDFFNLSIDFFNSSRGAASYFGIPGMSAQTNNGLCLGFTFGKNNKFSFEYFLSYILSTDQTSQSYGGFILSFITSEYDYFFQLDNDDCYFLPTDKYRTTKGIIGFRKKGNQNWGLSLGFNLWTGKLDGTDVGNEDYSYTLEGYGGEYSHGILYLKYRLNNLGISIGYDSEGIRDIIQNGWHDFYGRPHVPLLDREGKIYIELSLNELRYDY